MNVLKHSLNNRKGTNIYVGKHIVDKRILFLALNVAVIHLSKVLRLNNEECLGHLLIGKRHNIAVLDKLLICAVFRRILGEVIG